MTNEECAQTYELYWPLDKHHYIHPPDFSDPKSHWEQSFSGNGVGKFDRERRAKHKAAELDATASLFSLHTVRVHHSRIAKAKERAGEYWHGTIGGYSNQLCRCPRCAEAWRGAMKAYKAKKRANGQCHDCLAPAASDSSRCVEHLAQRRLMQAIEASR